MRRCFHVMRDHRVWILGAIVVLGTGLRLYGLAEYSIWYDEGATLRLADFSDSGKNLFDTDVSIDPPLFLPIVRVWRSGVKFLGLDRTSYAYDFCIRLLCAGFGVACIPLLYWAMFLVLRNRLAAWLAALLYAVSPFEIFYAQELRVYTLHTALSLVMVIFLVTALGSGGGWRWVGLVVSMVVLMYSHAIAIWTLVLANGCFLLGGPGHWKRVRPWFISQVFVGILILPMLLFAGRISAIYEQIEMAWSLEPKAYLGLISFKNYFAGYSARSAVYWPLFLMAGTIFVWGGWQLRRHWRAACLLLLFSLGPIIINVIFWKLKTFPIYEHRLFVFSAAIAYGVVGYGIAKLPSVGVRLGVLAGMLGLMAPCLADYYAQSLHPMETHRGGVRYKVDNREAADYIQSHWCEGDGVGHASHFTLYSFMHYMDVEQTYLSVAGNEQKSLLASVPTAALWQLHGVMPVSIQSALENRSRLWLVESFWEPFSPARELAVVRRWLDAHYQRLDSQVFYGLRVYLYDLQSPQFPGGARYRLCQDDAGEKPFYLSKPQGKGNEAIWKKHVEKMLSDLSTCDVSGLGLSFEGGYLCANEKLGAVLEQDGIGWTVVADEVSTGRQGLVSFPVTAEDEFSYSVVVFNQTEHPHALQCSVQNAFAFIDALQWKRLGKGGGWSYALRYDPKPPTGTYDDFVAVAKFPVIGGDDMSLHTGLSLPKGLYKLYANYIQEIAAKNISRATLTMYEREGNGKDLEGFAQINAFAQNGDGGWKWRYIADLESMGRQQELVATALNSDSLPEAYFDFAGIALLSSSDEEIVKEHFEVVLQPNERRRFVLHGALRGALQQHVKIKIDAPSTYETRAIEFVVRKKGYE